jgi:hypothetical protein
MCLHWQEPDLADSLEVLNTGRHLNGRPRLRLNIVGGFCKKTKTNSGHCFVYPITGEKMAFFLKSLFALTS